MALVQKKGGPYSKDDQESRRNEVHRLHFEFGYSARKIADVMKINRNTINSDMKYWYDSIKEEVKENASELVIQQLGRLEAQRTRIIENMSDATDKIRYEKLLLDIDAKINNILLKIAAENRTELENYDDLVKELVLFLIIKYSKEPSLKKEQVTSEIVNLCQCTVNKAETIFLDMISNGLECCKKFREYEFQYDLLEFAFLRKYIEPKDKINVKIQALCILENHVKIELFNLDKKFQEEFGGKEKWDDETFTKFDEKKEEINHRRADTTSKIVVEIIDELGDSIDSERFMSYMSCINVFFGNDKSEKLFDRIFEF